MHKDAKTLSMKPTHAWLQQLNLSFVRGPGSGLATNVAQGLLETAQGRGHTAQDVPDEDTDVIVTTAPFGEPLNWRHSLLFTARRRFGLEHSPTIYTVVHATRHEFETALDRLSSILPKAPPDPTDYDFPGLAEGSHQVLFEQGRRGGSLLALERVVQSQAKCIDVILIVGGASPEEAYLFNLVGAYPRIPADAPERFYGELVTRIATAESTQEVTAHAALGEPIPRGGWEGLDTPREMCEAGKQLGRRGFFTETVRIADLVNVPAVASAVSSQYSEGCFSTWDPRLDALIVTVTGSARPVYKGAVTEEDLTVITGLKPDGTGALVRQVEGRSNAPPSSEAVEMVMMDGPLPSVTLGESLTDVPVVRSKLHGHRGCLRYDPEAVEYVPMALPYQHYPVTCATDAQARGIADAFSRSEALQDPGDPRQIVFTVLPGHGIVIVEKWVPGTAPFQAIWEAMDVGSIEIDNQVPQGPIGYVATGNRMMLKRDQE